MRVYGAAAIHKKQPETRNSGCELFFIAYAPLRISIRNKKQPELKNSGCELFFIAYAPLRISIRNKKTTRTELHVQPGLSWWAQVDSNYRLTLIRRVL